METQAIASPRFTRSRGLGAAMKIGIVGTGSVAQALAEGLLRANHEIRFGSRDSSKARAHGLAFRLGMGSHIGLRLVRAKR